MSSFSTCSWPMSKYSERDEDEEEVMVAMVSPEMVIEGRRGASKEGMMVWKKKREKDWN